MTISRLTGALAALVYLLIAHNGSAYACGINLNEQVGLNQYGAGIGTGFGDCTTSPPATASGSGTYVSGTTTSDVRVMTFDMNNSGSFSAESMFGSTFIYVSDILFSSISDPDLSSVTVNNGELGIWYTVDADVSGPMLTTRSAALALAQTDSAAFAGTTPAQSDVSTGTSGYTDYFNSPNGFFSDYILPLNTSLGLYVQWRADLSTGPDPTYLDISVILGGSQLFKLPEDLTVNSASLGLVDNNFAVPVPAAVWLFVSGLLGLIGISRRKNTA